MKAFRVFMFTLAAMGVTACSSDDIIGDGQEQMLPLTITVAENPLLSPDTPAKAPTTRAAITETSTLTAFTLDYQYERGDELQTGQNNATKGGDDKWSAGLWPAVGDDTEVGWYAHVGGTFICQENPYLNFTVEELASAQQDLLVSTASGTKTDTGGNLNFTFDHACTALHFYVKKATNLADCELKVSSIKICHIVKQGKYYFATSSWTLGTDRSDYTLYDGTDLTLGTDDYVALDQSDAPYLFMIPQTLTAWDTTTAPASATAQTYIQLTCNITGATSYSGTAYIPFAATLAAGMLHDVKINIGKNSLYGSANTKIIQ